MENKHSGNPGRGLVSTALGASSSSVNVTSCGLGNMVRGVSSECVLPRTASLIWDTEAAVEGTRREAEAVDEAMSPAQTRSTPAQVQFFPLKTKRLGQMVTMGAFIAAIIGSRIQRVMKVCHYDNLGLTCLTCLWGILSWDPLAVCLLHWGAAAARNQ